MDKFDPNDWTKSFVRLNREFCIKFLIQTNEEILSFVKKGEYKTAVAGLDRMLNGMITMHNAKTGDFRPFVCGLSFVEGDIIACAFNDSPNNKRRDTALKAFMDARDYSKGGMGEFATMAIDALQSGISFIDFIAKFDPDFPNGTVINILSDTTKRLNDLL